MNEFVQKHAAVVIGILAGFDRLVFRGTLRNLAFVEGLMRYLSFRKILLKGAATHLEAVSDAVKAAATARAEKAERPLIYLPSAATSKEDEARKIALRDKISQGLVCVFKTVEGCQSFEIHRNRERKMLELHSVPRKCLHFYFYWLHPQMGLMHARLETWFPFNTQVCLNGREWLARTLEAQGLGYRKSDNCFRWLADCARAQALADAQLRTDWPRLLEAIAREINPLYPEIFLPYKTEYYWSAHQTEWATDVMFKSPEALAALYPHLVQHGITTFQSADVLRFLGQKLTRTGRVHGNFRGEVVTDLKQRPEGLRLKHRLGQNSLKVYDKQGSVLRVETTLNNPHAFKTFRPAEGGPQDQLAWRKMRKGVADLARRAEVSAASNERYLQALAQVHSQKPLGQCVQDICRPVAQAGQRYRALQPLGQDAALLKTLARGEYCINGFRNRDLQQHLYPTRTDSQAERKKRSAQVTRRLRLLRAHGLIKKVPKTHRYQLTEKGRELIVALCAAAQASVQQLTTLAA